MTVARAGGKGIGDHALASALYELLEHAAAKGLLPDSSPQVVDREPDPPAGNDAIVNFATRNRIRRSVGFQRVNSKYELSGPHYWYPASACDLSISPLSPAERHLNFYSSSSGFASGGTVREALIHALNEVVERDAVGTALIDCCLTGESPRSFIELSDESLEVHRRELSVRTGNTIRVSLLDSLAGYVAAAFAMTRAGAYPLVGYGASRYGQYAIERSLGEVLQELSANEQGFGIEHDGGSPGLKPLKRYPRLLAASQLPHPLVHSELSDASMDITGIRDSPDPLEQLGSSGYEVYGRVVWHHEGTGICVVQVIVPASERFHLIKFGYPVEPTGRRRSPTTISFFRSGQ